MALSIAVPDAAAAPVVLRAGRQARVKVRVSKAARRALRRGALRAVATLSVRGKAGAAAASAKLRLR